LLKLTAVCIVQVCLNDARVSGKIGNLFLMTPELLCYHWRTHLSFGDVYHEEQPELRLWSTRSFSSYNVRITLLRAGIS